VSWASPTATLQEISGHLCCCAAAPDKMSRRSADRPASAAALCRSVSPPPVSSPFLLGPDVRVNFAGLLNSAGAVRSYPVQMNRQLSFLLLDKSGM
jgi:hypothetical protein